MPTDASSPAAVLRALSDLGPERLADIGHRVGAELNVKVRPTAMAEQLLHAIGQPEDFGHLGLSDGEVESIGVAVGHGERSDWTPTISAEEFDRLPFYSKPSYDQDVWAAVSHAIAHVTKAAKPAAKKAATKRSAARKPPATKAAAKKPAARKPAARKPAAKKPAAKKPAAKKPAAKKLAAKKPATKKRRR